ncbi:MAG TPA: hypothetical protein GXX40_01600 [Firmicutes bacterium]|nr:hypothetical protein [Bacillota bacterium]
MCDQKELQLRYGSAARVRGRGSLATVSRHIHTGKLGGNDMYWRELVRQLVVQDVTAEACFVWRSDDFLRRLMKAKGLMSVAGKD